MQIGIGVLGHVGRREEPKTILFAQNGCVGQRHIAEKRRLFLPPDWERISAIERDLSTCRAFGNHPDFALQFHHKGVGEMPRLLEHCSMKSNRAILTKLERRN